MMTKFAVCLLLIYGGSLAKCLVADYEMGDWDVSVIGESTNAEQFNCVSNMVSKDTAISFIGKSSYSIREASKDDYEPVIASYGETSKHQKRPKERSNPDQSSLTCDLKIVVDYPYFSNVAHFNQDRAVSSVVNVMKKVDSLFRVTDFNADGQPENIGFYISDIKVYVDPITESDNQTSKWDPTKFFTEMKRYDFTDACAGLLFTYRQMQSPELFGPSIFKSTLNSTNLGICSTNPAAPIPTQIEDNYGAYISNAVPVNFQQHHRVCKHTTHMATLIAHQLAQLFGAQTDDDTATCNITNPLLMNIMAYPVPPGHFTNNQLFSQCSKAAITEYLTRLPRPCLKLCRGTKCSVKRSMLYNTNSTNDTATHSAAVYGPGVTPVTIITEIIIPIIFNRWFF